MKQIKFGMRTFKLFLFIYLPIMVVMIFSCEELFNLEDEEGLTTEEIVEGLKTALEVGTDSAANILHQTNGYYKDEAVKILLPEEAQVIYDTQQKLDPYLNQIGFSLEDQIEKVVLGINRSAETAANDAKPIFVNAITSMSITDAMDILEGRVPDSGSTKAGMITTETFDSTAATKYFQSVTYEDLVLVFSTPIDNALDTDLGLGFSANDAWNTLTSNYNQAVGLYNTAINLNPLNTTEELEPIEVSIAEHCTQKALDGLFLKVGEEEKKIRKDPFQWALDILQKVFGSVLDQ